MNGSPTPHAPTPRQDGRNGLSASSSARDPVGLAVASIGAGAAAGAALIAAGAALLRVLQRGAAGPVADAAFAILGISLFCGIAAAVIVGWLTARAIRESWRRGVIAALSVFGAFPLAMLAAPADLAGGPAGLGAYLVALLVMLRYTRAAARRAATP